MNPKSPINQYDECRFYWETTGVSTSTDSGHFRGVKKDNGDGTWTIELPTKMSGQTFDWTAVAK